MTELQTRISMDPTNPEAFHAGVQAICDHIAALHNTNYALALTLGAAVAELDRNATGNVGEIVMKALDSLGTMGFESTSLDALRAIIVKLAPTPPDGGTRLTIVRTDEGERTAA